MILVGDKKIPVFPFSDNTLSLIVAPPVSVALPLSEATCCHASQDMGRGENGFISGQGRKQSRSRAFSTTDTFELHLLISPQWLES